MTDISHKCFIARGIRSNVLRGFHLAKGDFPVAATLRIPFRRRFWFVPWFSFLRLCQNQLAYAPDGLGETGLNPFG
jgi:hypothetical protein